MGTTANRQREAKRDMDHKLSLSTPDRSLLEELAVSCAANPSDTNATFQYAFALSKSTEPSELRYAVNMLDSLVVEGKFEHQVDCMFGAATALYLLGDYAEARVRSFCIRLVAWKCCVGFLTNRNDCGRSVCQVSL
jgi:mitochondrial fission 1 protein